MTARFGHVAVTFLDALGVSTTQAYYVDYDDTKTIAAAVGEAQSLAQDLDNVSDSQITEVKLQIVGTLPGAGKSAPVSTAENERTGLLNFSQTGSPYKYGVVIPAIADSKIVNGKIDLTNTDITNLITLLTTAGTVFTYVSTAIKALAKIVDALLSFRKHRKAESRRSFEVAP